MKSLLKVSAFALLLSAVSYTVNAQTCPVTLESKNGKVYSANPGNVVATSTSNQVTIKFKKTDGRAEAQVNFYINNVMQPAHTINLDNGNWTDNNWRTVTLNGVSGKQVKVKIVNQSATNTISYSCNISGNITNLIKNDGDGKGRVVGPTQGSQFTTASCTGKTRVTIDRTGGTAPATVTIYQKIGNNWVPMPAHTQLWQVSNGNYNQVVNSTRELKVVVANNDNRGNISYDVDAVPAN